MSKCKAFLNKANEFARRLVAHESGGIAMIQTDVNAVYETIHRGSVEEMFPPSRIPLASSVYMDTVKQLTNFELVPYFRFMKHNGVFVVDPRLVNQPSTRILRVPPSPLVMPYKTLHHNTSIEMSKLQGIQYVGRAGELINEENIHQWCVSSYGVDYGVLGKVNAKTYQHLETLVWLLAAMDNNGQVRNERLNLAGNSLPLFMYGRGSWTRPSFLYDGFAQLHLSLSQAETYVFTHGDNNVWTEFLARSARMRVQPEHATNMALNYDVESQEMWAEHNSSPKPSFRMVWG